MILPRVQVPSVYPDFSPYRLPGLQAAYDLTDSAQLKVDASNRVSFAADKSGNSAVMGLVLPGTSGNYASTPDAAPLRITGDMLIDAFAVLPTWTPASSVTIANKWENTGNQRAYLLYLTTSGTVQLFCSTTGLDSPSATSSVAVAFTAYQAGWVRATRRNSDGKVRFYTSTDGSTWTQLGTDQTLSSGTSTFSSTAAFRIGADQTGGTGDMLAGMILRVKVMNGFDGAGSVVFDADFTKQARGATSFTESSVNAATVTVNTSGDLGARICGARDLAMMTGSKQPLLLPFSGQNYAYLPGAAGNNVSTPNAAANQITGNIEFWANLILDSAPSARGWIISKWANVDGKRAYGFTVENANTLGLIQSTDGTGSTITICSFSTAIPYAVGTKFYAKVTVNTTSRIAQAFTSLDNITWTQLGANSTISNGGFFASSAPVIIGDQGSTNESFPGRIFAAEIRNGIGGPAVTKMDASQAANNATSWTSSTGEVWTVNSTGAKPAQIVGAQSLLFDGSSWYMQTPPFTLNQPATVVFVGKQNTWVANNRWFDGAGGTNRGAVQDVTSSPGVRLLAGSIPGSAITPASLGVLAVTQVQFNGASSFMRLNRGSTQTQDAGTAAMSGFTLAAGGTGGADFDAEQVMYVLLFSTAQDIATLDRIALWAGKLAGITV